MAKKATPAKAPKGGEHDRPPDDAPEEEIKWYNAFVKEWKNSGKRYFANDEAIWRAIVPRLKFTGHSTTVIYNHFIGKLRKDIDWGHLVAALIMWGPDIVKTSAFGERAQASCSCSCLPVPTLRLADEYSSLPPPNLHLTSYCELHGTHPGKASRYLRLGCGKSQLGGSGSSSGVQSC